MESQKSGFSIGKKKRTYLLLLIFILIFLLFALIFLSSNNQQLQDRIFKAALKQRVQLPRTDLGGEKNLDIIFCGSGSPFPDPINKRGQPCLAIFAKNHFFLFDVGSDSAAKLAVYRLPLKELSQVFLTHLHSDHFSGLGEVRLLTWLQGKSSSLKVLGPNGTKRTVEGYKEAYFMDSTFRIAHHGAEYLNPSGTTYQTQEIQISQDEKSKVVFEDGAFKITAFLVDHSPIKHAFGYRVDFGDRSLTISGDSIKHPNIAEFSKNVDILVHEALNPMMVRRLEKRFHEIGNKLAARLMKDILNYHTSPLEAAETANRAKAKLLVLTHIVPPLPNALVERIFLRKASKIRKENTLLAFDGLHLRLPLGKKTILKGDFRP